MAKLTLDDSRQEFSGFFRRITSHSEPRDWQEHLAMEQQPRSRLIRIPTGLGKTEGVLAAWVWHAMAKPDTVGRLAWPRRVVWCLPMRVLVEQTANVARRLIESAGLDIGVHMLMGGIEPSSWHLYPERPAVLIGTQDMLLSRALNRGYATGRARWPHEFGLLNHDSLWVMDEIQLMDVGLATSAQLQAYRDGQRESGFRPCHTWWMSATLQSEWLQSVDTETALVDWCVDPCQVPAAEMHGGIWEVKKTMSVAAIAAADAAAFAHLILERHAHPTAG